jgi:hypothetical protein
LRDNETQSSGASRREIADVYLLFKMIANIYGAHKRLIPKLSCCGEPLASGYRRNNPPQRRFSGLPNR